MQKMFTTKFPQVLFHIALLRADMDADTHLLNCFSKEENKH